MWHPFFCRLEWAKTHDAEAHNIAEAGRRFAQQNLMPLDIYCYHAVIFKVSLLLLEAQLGSLTTAFLAGGGGGTGWGPAMSSGLGARTGVRAGLWTGH